MEKKLLLAVNNYAGYALDTLGSEGAEVERQFAQSDHTLPSLVSPANKLTASKTTSFNFGDRKEGSVSRDLTMGNRFMSGARKTNPPLENSLTMRSRNISGKPVDQDAELDDLLDDLPEVGEDDPFFLGDDSPVSTPRKF